MVVMRRKIADESARVAAIDAEAGPASIAAQQAMTAKYNAMGLNKVDWEDHGHVRLRGQRQNHMQHGLCEMEINGNTYLKGEMVNNAFAGGLCRLIDPEGRVFLGPKTGEEFNGIGMIKYSAGDGGFTYYGEISGSKAEGKG